MAAADKACVALGHTIRLPSRHANRLRGKLTGALQISRAHEIVGLERQHSGLELEGSLAAAGCVQRLLEKAVGLGEVPCRRGRQTLAETREHHPKRDCRLSCYAGHLIGVSCRRERVGAKPGKFDGIIMRDALVKQFGFGRINLQQPGQPLIRVGKPPEHDQRPDLKAFHPMRNIEADHLADCQAKDDARIAPALVVDQIQGRAIRLQSIADEAREQLAWQSNPFSSSASSGLDSASSTASASRTNRTYSSAEPFAAMIRP